MICTSNFQALGFQGSRYSLLGFLLAGVEDGGGFGVMSSP